MFVLLRGQTVGPILMKLNLDLNIVYILCRNSVPSRENLDKNACFGKDFLKLYRKFIIHNTIK